MKINQLDHYPRFVFNCSDDYGFATDDLDLFKFFRNENDMYPITSFKMGEEVTLKRDDQDEPVLYKISDIQIRDIRYDTNEKLYGVYEDDRATYQNKEKFHVMSIFISLDLIP
ncbi:MAG: hypothetical protein EOO47_02675 [Flavobacterium sp.]|nr:MAG: hypothetical protein EOO47_02675 [Flavobacterium sp.]